MQWACSVCSSNFVEAPEQDVEAFLSPVASPVAPDGSVAPENPIGTAVQTLISSVLDMNLQPATTTTITTTTTTGETTTTTTTVHPTTGSTTTTTVHPPDGSDSLNSIVRPATDLLSSILSASLQGASLQTDQQSYVAFPGSTLDDLLNSIFVNEPSHGHTPAPSAVVDSLSSIEVASHAVACMLHAGCTYVLASMLYAC